MFYFFGRLFPLSAVAPPASGAAATIGAAPALTQASVSPKVNHTIKLPNFITIHHFMFDKLLEKMPEGPSIVILKEESLPFKGKKILAVEGNTKTIDKDLLKNKTVKDFKSWGKHFLICFKGFTIRIHFLLFGSYRINESKSSPVRLGLKFNNGTLNFYACSVKLLQGNLDELYDWETDVMNDEWDPAEAKKRLTTIPEALVCDALLNQSIFAGVGNIIKNEVLYRIKVHPQSKIGKLSATKLNQLIKESRNYSFDFLHWKKQYVLKKHWLVHTKKTCTRCKGPITKQYLGTTNRRTFFCTKCQKIYQ